MTQTSTKPYLIRAIHEWCSDNGFTPYIAVAVDERTVVPREHVRNDEIVLNVSSMATVRLTLGNDLIEFQARFGGVARELSIPVENVTAIYARENGQGMAFEAPKAPAAGVVQALSDPGAPGSSPAEPATPVAAAPSKPPQPVSLSVVEPPAADDDDRPDPAPDRPKRAKLTRIK
jgi:stringent starvation protein B